MAYIPHGTIVNTETADDLKAVFSDDTRPDIFQASPGVTVRLIYTAQSIPIPNIPWNSALEMRGIASENGANFVELELAPHTQSAMHSTQSVDLGVVITGEIVLGLDSGEERVLKYVPCHQLCIDESY